MTKLSNSGYNKYTQCPQLYKLHYIDRIRSTSTGAALAFGSAIDDALNALLEGSETDPYTVFDQSFSVLNINGVNEMVRSSTNITFNVKDWDFQLFTDEEMDGLLVECQALGYPGENVNGLVRDLFKKAGRNEVRYNELTDKQKKCLALCCFESLTKKAGLMLDVYIEEILPILSEVSGVQKDLYSNGINGKLDFKGKIDGYPDVMVIDNKTSKNKYLDNAVNDGHQLHLYSWFEQTDQAAYIVLLKEISHYVRKPSKAKYQIIVGDVSERQKEDTALAMREVVQLIEKGPFPKNFNSCSKMYGKHCPYYNKCRNGSMQGLVYLNKADEGKKK